jgi:hypothetical protein
MRLNPAQAPADGQVPARCRITPAPGLCSTHIPTPRAQVVSTRQTGNPSPVHPLIRPLIPRRAGGRRASRPAIAGRAAPAKDDRSQLAHY